MNLTWPEIKDVPELHRLLSLCQSRTHQLGAARRLQPRRTPLPATLTRCPRGPDRSRADSPTFLVFPFDFVFFFPLSSYVTTSFNSFTSKAASQKTRTMSEMAPLVQTLVPSPRAEPTTQPSSRLSPACSANFKIGISKAQIFANKKAVFFHFSVLNADGTRSNSLTSNQCLRQSQQVPRES